MRPSRIHKFEISSSSLYSAISLQYTTATILSMLDNLSKNFLPIEVSQFIEKHTQHYGKAKCVLEGNKYYIECEDEGLFQIICRLKSVRKYHDQALQRGESLRYVEKKQQGNKGKDINTVIDEDRDEMIIFMENCFNSENRKQSLELRTTNRLEIGSIDVTRPFIYTLSIDSIEPSKKNVYVKESHYERSMTITPLIRTTLL